jgi:hypothetical protein
MDRAVALSAATHMGPALTISRTPPPPWPGSMRPSSTCSVTTAPRADRDPASIGLVRQSASRHPHDRLRVQGGPTRADGDPAR